MKDDKRMIWSSDYDVKNFEEWLDEEYPDADEYEREQLVWDLNQQYLGDERMNLGDIIAPAGIVVLASLGLWDGRKPAYREIDSGKVKDCLHYQYDDAEFYCDRYNFCGIERHHDGTNFYTYRAWKENLSEQQKDNFLRKWLSGESMSCDVTRYTRSLRPEIAKVYGW